MSNATKQKKVTVKPKYDGTTGERLAWHRERKGITQQELAAIVDCKRQVIDFYESGVRLPSLLHLECLADVLGISTDYILCRTTCEKGNPDVMEIEKRLGLTSEAQQIIANIENKSLLNKFLTTEIDSPVEFTHSQNEKITAFRLMLAEMEIAKIEIAVAPSKRESVTDFINRAQFNLTGENYPVTAEILKHFREARYIKNAVLLFDKITEKEDLNNG